jgi:hypothetical protein
MQRVQIRSTRNTLSLVDNLERLKLDYEIILGLHGRQATKADLTRAVGKPIS